MNCVVSDDSLRQGDFIVSNPPVKVVYSFLQRFFGFAIAHNSIIHGHQCNLLPRFSFSGLDVSDGAKVEGSFKYSDFSRLRLKSTQKWTRGGFQSSLRRLESKSKPKVASLAKQSRGTKAGRLI